MISGANPGLSAAGAGGNPIAREGGPPVDVSRPVGPVDAMKDATSTEDRGGDGRQTLDTFERSGENESAGDDRSDDRPPPSGTNDPTGDNPTDGHGDGPTLDLVI